jgi:hypothetical protein
MAEWRCYDIDIKGLIEKWRALSDYVTKPATHEAFNRYCRVPGLIPTAGFGNLREAYSP